VETDDTKKGENPENWRESFRFATTPEQDAELRRQVEEMFREGEDASETKKVEKTEQTDSGVR